MTIEELALHYRRTGDYLPEAQRLEGEYIGDNIKAWQDEFDGLNDEEKDGLDFEEFIGVHIGMWQANHGFTLKIDNETYEPIYEK